VVAGLGLNVTLGAAIREFIAAGGNRASDLAELAGGTPPAREALVAAILEHNVALLGEFARTGFIATLDEYRAADALRDRPVRILGGGGGAPGGGIARGVDAGGALLVEHDGRIHRIIAGEVSVRPEEES
jgi:BirA family biotin operon repressor/biotin-[acetyl-CoA-carboxylase] ligase